MQLTYRGQNYKFSTVSVELDNSQATGKYRGVSLTFAPPEKPIFCSNTYKYRGIEYTKDVKIGTDISVRAPQPAIA